MERFDLKRRLAAECLGTALLVATVVGSGIMAEALAGGNLAVALIGNTAATGAILFVLIAGFGNVSGAHFNPAVSLVFLCRRELSIAAFALYVIAQIVGGIAGTLLAHAMFDLPLVQVSRNARDGTGIFASEIVATFGLIATILCCLRFRSGAVPAAVACYIMAGYWFTASTGFANPAVTIARSLTDTFAGIRPEDAPGFIVAEIVGALLALVVFRWLLLPASSEARRAPQPQQPVGIAPER